jgi:hypothetical protein
MVFKKSDISYLKDLTSKKDHNKDGIKKVIELYEQRKIPRRDTAELLIYKFKSKGKKKKKDAIEQLSKYDKQEPITGKLKKAEDETINKNKAITKIQKLFRKTAKFNITENEAFKKNVLQITVIPEKVGSIIRSDIQAYIAKTFLQAKARFKHIEEYKIYAICTLNILEKKSDKPGNDLYAKSETHKSSELNKFFTDFMDKIYELIQSDEKAIIKKVEYFIATIPSGKGCGTASREYESIMNKKSVISIINNNNNCFWYAEACLMNPTNRTIRDHRNQKARDKVAMNICNKCKLQWDTPMRIDNIIFVEKTYNININVIELQNLPSLGGNVNIFNSLLYKSDNRDTMTHYLLYDSEKEHYNAITDIKAFLGVRCFCDKCLKGFSNKADYEKHECNTNVINKRKVDKRTETKMVKELSHYLTKNFTKGSSQEIEQATESFQEQIKHPRYIIYDFETDTDTSIHKPNHVEVDVLKIDDTLTHQYDKCLVKQFGINGYNC